MALISARTARFLFVAAGWGLLASLSLFGQVSPANAQSESFKTQRLSTRASGNAAVSIRQPQGTLALFAVDDGDDDGSSTLFRIGTSAVGGVVDLEVIGETGIRDIWDIAFVGNRLYGIAGPTDRLYEIDPDSAIATLVKDFNIPSQPNALIAESATTLLTVTSALGQVWRIDLELLTAELVGDYGDYRSSGDLAFDVGGRLFGAVDRGSALSDLLVSVDPLTGAAQPIGDLLFQQVYGLAIELPSRTLFGVVDSELAPKLVTINKNDGHPTVVGSIPNPNGVTGLAICSQCLFADDFESGDSSAWSVSVP